MPIAEVHINCPNEEIAAVVAETLVSERLAAASNTTAPIQSRYWWKGRLETQNEITVVLKTRQELVEAVVQRVRVLHPYQTPGILVFTPSAANEDYEEWIDISTRDG